MTKIIECAICKNEESRVLRWLESLRDVDEIFLLDTGSTDSTLSLLSNQNKANLHVYSKKWDAFDFSEARNYICNIAKTSIPNDGNDYVFIHFDLDEFVLDGEIERLRKEWNPNSMICTAYSIGNESMHTSRICNGNIDFHWEFPIHEELAFSSHVTSNKIQNLDIKYIHEHVDSDKKSDFYFDIMYDWYKRDKSATQPYNHLLDVLGSSREVRLTFTEWENIINDGIELSYTNPNKMKYTMLLLNCLLKKSRIYPSLELFYLDILKKTMETRANGKCISKNFYRYYANRVEALLPNDSFKYHLIEELMTMYNNTKYNDTLYYPFYEEIFDF